MRQWTYAELDDLAERWSSHLQATGLEIEQTVGILLEPGFDQIVMQLAILRAGGTCVPLDPALPDVRIESMLASLHINPCSHVAGHAPARGVPSICSLSRTPRKAITASVRAAYRAEHRTHVLHTSGSTGRPKGVEIVARGVLRLVLNRTFAPPRRGRPHRPHQQSQLRCVPVRSVGRPAQRCDRGGPAQADDHRSVRAARQPAASWCHRDVHDDGPVQPHCAGLPDAFRGLRHLATGGEAANAHALREVLLHSNPQNLRNGYGPTECTTFATTFDVTLDSLPVQGPVSIGQALDNTQVTISSTNTGAPSSKANRVSFTWVATDWRGATTANRNRPLNASSRCPRSPERHRSASIAPATSHVATRMVASTSGPHGSPDQAARLPHRAGRDRIGDAGERHGIRGGGRPDTSRAGGSVSGRLCGPCRRRRLRNSRHCASTCVSTYQSTCSPASPASATFHSTPMARPIARHCARCSIAFPQQGRRCRRHAGLALAQGPGAPLVHVARRERRRSGRRLLRAGRKLAPGRGTRRRHGKAVPPDGIDQGAVRELHAGGTYQLPAESADGPGDAPGRRCSRCAACGRKSREWHPASRRRHDRLEAPRRGPRPAYRSHGLPGRVLPARFAAAAAREQRHLPRTCGKRGRRTRRVQNNLRDYGLWDDAWLARLRVVTGDLADPHLGQGEAGFNELARWASVVSTWVRTSITPNRMRRTALPMCSAP